MFLTSQPPQPLTHRARAMLFAVDAGRAEISLSCEPDLYVDGVPCCDQTSAHELAHAGLVRPAHPGLVGQRVRAVVTADGAAAIAAATTAA